MSGKQRDVLIEACGRVQELDRKLKAVAYAFPVEPVQCREAIATLDECIEAWKRIVGLPAVLQQVRVALNGELMLQGVIERLIEEGVEMRVRAYSGRGMYGDECLAVVADDAMGTLQVIAEQAGREGVTMPSDVRQDTMGKQTVIYWPQVAFQERGNDLSPSAGEGLTT